MRARYNGVRGLAALGLLAFSGCAHAPDVRERPDLAARVTGPSTATPGSDRPDGEQAPVADPRVERTAFEVGTGPNAPTAEPLTVEEAQRLGLRYSPVLAQARAVVDGARANVDVAESGFLPTVQGNYGFQAFSSQTGFAGTPVGGRFPILPVRGFGPGSQDFNVAEVQMKWTIFQFGKLLSQRGQAVLKTEIANLRWERARQTVFYEVSQAYFRVLEARSTVEIAERAVEQAEVFRKESQDLLRRGAITQEEHLVAEARLAQVKQERTDAKSEEAVAIAALNRAIGIDVNAPTRVAERREAPECPLTLEQSLNLAVANRREIPVVTRGIAVAEEDVNIARADFLPSVSVQAGYSNVTGTRVQNANVSAGGIFITHELYGGGRRRGQLRAAEASVRSAVAQAQQVCDGIAYEVNVAFHGVEDGWERIGAARASFEQASENRRLVDSRYRGGDATPSELTAAYASATRADQTYNAAFYQYQRALAQLEFAVGAELPLRAAEARTEGESAPVPALPAAPPTGRSPFAPRAGAATLPGLPPPVEFRGPTLPPSAPLPPTEAPLLPGMPRPFGPPSLSRPPYESTSPFGARP